jgi:hypothetical protein
VASRKEQKERLRKERLAREAEEKRRAERNRRLQMVGGGVIGVGVVAAVVVAIVAGTSGGSDKPKQSGQINPQVKAVPIPPRKTTDLFATAKAAGCTGKAFPDDGRQHITGTGTYKTNPPTSGNHNPMPAEDGDYSGEQSPAKENAVHTLEHGRIEFQYRPGTPAKVIGQMRTLFNEGGAYHSLLFANTTDMPYKVAAIGWTHLIGCKAVNDKTWDAMRAFRQRYVDQAPEQIP